MTDPRIEQSLAEMIATIENSGVTQTFPPSVDAIGYDAGRRGVAPELRAWHARAMKLAIAYVFRNSSGTFTCDDCGEAGTVPSTIVHSEDCEVGKWLALLGDLAK